MRVEFLSDSNCCSEPSYAAVEEDGTSGLVIEVFDDLHKVCADVVLLHGSYSFLQLCCEESFFTSIQEDGCDEGAHQSYLGAERNAQPQL